MLELARYCTFLTTHLGGLEMKRNEWLNSSSYWAIQTMYGKRTPIINGDRFTPLWWTGEQPLIRIFRESNISQETISFVGNIILEIMGNIDNNIIPSPKIELRGLDQSAIEQINDACILGKIDDNKLADIALAENCRKSQQHGDIYVTTKQFVDDSVSWGAASFEHGMMVLALYGDRQRNINFLKKVVHHELGHMLGSRLHCNKYTDIDSYIYDTSCVMHYSCASNRMCDKCKDWIRQWWTQIKYEISK